MNIGTIEGVIRLKDQFTAVLNRAVGQLDISGKKLQSIGKKISGVGETLTKTVTLPLIAAGGGAIKMASDFESSFAGVRKTVNATEEELAQLAQGLRDLAAGPDAIPIDVNKLNAVAESAGQLGIAKSDILAFTKTMADLGETTNLTALEAAESTAQFQNIFGAAGVDVDRFGSTLVALGNAGASTERDIISMGLRIAGAGNQIGLSQGEVLAFASALSSVGIEAEAGGSALSKVMINIALAVSKGGAELHNFASVAGLTVSDFQKLFKEDAAQAVNAFISGLGNIGKSGGDTLKVLDAMGISEVRMRDALLRAAGAGGLLADSLKLQKKAWSDNNALTEEAKKRYQTFESQLKVAWNRIKDVGITLGTALMPALTDFLDIIRPLIERLAKLAQWFAKLDPVTRKTALVIMSIAAATGPVLIGLGHLIKAYGTIVLWAPKVAAYIKLVNLAFVAQGLAIAGVLLYINHLITKWKEATDAAMEYEVQTASRQGRTFEFIRMVQQAQAAMRQAGQVGPVRVEESFLVRARADATALQTEITQLETRISSLQNTIARGSTQDARTGGESSTSALARRQLEEAQRNLSHLRAESSRLEQALTNVEGVAERVVPALNPDIPDPSPWDIAGDDADDLAKRLATLTRDLTLTAKQNRQLADTFNKLSGVTKIQKSAAQQQIEQVRKAHAIHTAYLSDLDEFGKEAADALRLLREADFDAAKQAEDAEGIYLDLSGALESVADAAKEASTGLTDSVEAMANKIDEDFRKIIDSLNIKKQLDLEAEYAIRISAIDEATPRLREIEEQYLDFLRNLGRGSVSEGEKVFADLAAKFGFTIDQIKAKLGEIADAQILGSIQGAGRSSLESFRNERNNLQRIIDESLADYTLSAERRSQIEKDGSAAINRMTKDYWSEQLGHWSQALDYLAGQFGGFFEQIAGMVQGIQGAVGFGDSVTNIAGGTFKLSGGTASALGSVATVFGIYWAIFDAVDQFTKQNNLKKFGQVNTFEIRDSLDVTNFWDNPDKAKLDNWGREFAKTISGLVRGIEETLGISIERLTAVSIKFRNDGQQVRAYVEGRLIGLFSDVTEAIQAALAVALRSDDSIITGLSDLMRQGLDVRTPDLEELTTFLAQLRDISDLGLPQAAVQIRETIRNLNELWVALTRIREVTPAVTEGFSDLVMAEALAWQEWFDTLTGRQKTDEERLAALQAEARIANAQKNLRELEVKAKILEYQQEVEVLRRRLDITRQGGVIGGIVLQQQGAELQARAGFAKISGTLVEAQVAMYDAQIKALEELLAALEALPDINIPDLKLPDVPSFGRDGGRGLADAGRSLADLLAEFANEQALRGMTEYQKRFKEINDKWNEGTAGIRPYNEALARAKRRHEEAVKAADGNEAKIKAADEAYRKTVNRINDSREALDRANQARQEEIRLLDHETRVDVAGKFAEFLGLVSPFEKIQQTAADLIKEIEGSPFGDVRKARMIGRILNDVDRQITKLSQETASNLLGSMIGDLEKFGASESLLSEARKNLAIIEHTLKLNHYRTEIEILKAQGRLSAEVLATLDKSLRFLEGVDPTKLTGGSNWRDLLNKPPSGGSAGDSANSLADAIDRARDLLKKYQDSALDPLSRSLLEINDDFREIRLALGETTEVTTAYAQAVQRAIDNFLEPIRNVQRDLAFGDLSAFDVETQWEMIQQEFANAQARFRLGDLSVVEDVPELVQDLIRIAREVTPVGSEAFRDIFAGANLFLNEVLRLTPDQALGSVSNPMAVAGMSDLTAISEAQLDTLDRIYRSSERVVAAIDRLNARSADTRLTGQQAA